MSMDDFIPPGFAPLANWDSRNRRNNDGHSVEWKTLSDAVKDGEIPGFKLSNGRWYVHQQSAEELLSRPAERPAEPKRAASMSPGQYEAAVVALCEINNGITLMHATLEQLTAAVRSVLQAKNEHEYLTHYAPASNGTHQ
jgi:hypothetical protein